MVVGTTFSNVGELLLCTFHRATCTCVQCRSLLFEQQNASLLYSRRCGLTSPWPTARLSHLGQQVTVCLWPDTLFHDRGSSELAAASVFCTLSAVGSSDSVGTLSAAVASSRQWSTPARLCRGTSVSERRTVQSSNSRSGHGRRVVGKMVWPLSTSVPTPHVHLQVEKRSGPRRRGSVHRGRPVLGRLCAQ